MRLAEIPWTIALIALAGCMNLPLPSARETAPADQLQVLGDLPGLDRVVRLNLDLIRGAQPIGEAGFQTLKGLGIRTILNVDEAGDDRSLAGKYGFDYHEVVLDYQGITPEQSRRMVEIYRSANRPIYIHCHQGKHRVGEAAAIYRMGIQGWSNDRAEQEMADLGCSRLYTGLFEAVRSWKPENLPLSPGHGAQGSGKR